MTGSNLLDQSISQTFLGWCPGPELNRYVPFGTRDFKSRASASFATRASCGCFAFYRSILPEADHSTSPALYLPITRHVTDNQHGRAINRILFHSNKRLVGVIQVEAGHAGTQTDLGGHLKKVCRI